MRKNSFLTFLKEKSFILVLTLMLVSAGTMAALFALGGDDSGETDQMAEQTENQPETEMADTANGAEEAGNVEEAQNLPRTVVEKTTDTKENSSEEQDAVKETASMEAELEDQYLEAEEMAQVSGADVIAEGFSEGSVLSLMWPVEGEVLLEFAMDHSIYFPTLAQYQYNPAMIIASAEGTQVLAAAAGTVTDVGKSNEYGHYVTMDLGDGFEITYGQLFEITTEVGEVLEAGERFALVAYPTRNYSEEGENLYLQLKKDGTAVDPELYLEK